MVIMLNLQFHHKEEMTRQSGNHTDTHATSLALVCVAGELCFSPTVALSAGSNDVKTTGHETYGDVSFEHDQ